LSEDDRRRWDARHAETETAATVHAMPPPLFAPFEDLFPTRGLALELACGRGQCAVWLARRGMEVYGIDVSPVAIELARDLAARSGVADRCRFDAVDLDAGLPAGPPADLILCHLFRDARLDRSILDRLAIGGLLAIAALSEVGARPGRFRAGSGELRDAFRELELLAHGEGEGHAWLLGRRRS
jgi:SAM-dependent methyltransferase